MCTALVAVGASLVDNQPIPHYLVHCALLTRLHTRFPLHVTNTPRLLEHAVMCASRLGADVLLYGICEARVTFETVNVSCPQSNV